MRRRPTRPDRPPFDGGLAPSPTTTDSTDSTPIPIVHLMCDGQGRDRRKQQ